MTAFKKFGTVGELFNEIMGNSSVKCVDYAN
jgi:hypothetical protein